MNNLVAHVHEKYLCSVLATYIILSVYSLQNMILFVYQRVFDSTISDNDNWQYSSHGRIYLILLEQMRLSWQHKKRRSLFILKKEFSFKENWIISYFQNLKWVTEKQRFNLWPPHSPIIDNAYTQNSLFIFPTFLPFFLSLHFLFVV